MANSPATQCRRHLTPSSFIPTESALSNSVSSKPSPVIYCMFRDQCSHDNWALLHTAHLVSLSDSPFIVAFTLFPCFLGAHAHQLTFMLYSLCLLIPHLTSLNIPFFLLYGEAAVTLPHLINSLSSSALVIDFSPLRPVRAVKDQICENISNLITVYEVNAHNVMQSPPLLRQSRPLIGGVSPVMKKMENYLVQKVAGDGRCMFRALVKGMVRNKEVPLSAS